MLLKLQVTRKWKLRLLNTQDTCKTVQPGNAVPQTWTIKPATQIRQSQLHQENPAENTSNREVKYEII